MLGIISAFIGQYTRYIEYGILLAILALTYYAGYHTRVVLDKAADSEKTTTIIQSIPQIIHETQTITRVVHDANDSCTHAAIPAGVLAELRK